MPLSFFIRFTPPFFCELMFAFPLFLPFFACGWLLKDIGLEGSFAAGFLAFAPGAGLLTGVSF